VRDDVQAAPIDKLDVDDRWITVPAEVGDVRVRIVRPPGAPGPLPVILYMHGGGWVLGNADTHDRLVRGWIMREGAANQLDANRMAVARDSVGGNMTAALVLMANEPGDVRFVQHSMYYPVTGAAMDTGSYEHFAEGYFLTAKTMAWFWDAYAPDVDVLRDEGEAYAARLRAAGRPCATTASLTTS
jgi:acetyl esterase/lipase